MCSETVDPRVLTFGVPRTPPKVQSRKVVLAAIAGGACVALLKFLAAFATSSSAMFSEAIHSTVDTVNDSLMYFGIRQSCRPADEQHPFGYGKELYFYSLVVALIILAGGGGMSILDGIRHVRNPEPVHDPLWTYLTLGGSAIFEGASLSIAVREFRKLPRSGGILHAIHVSKDPANFSVMLEDIAALAGLLVAFLGIWASHSLGIEWADGAAAIVVGLILSAVAAILTYETHGLLIGEGASKQMLDELQILVSSDPDVLGMRRPYTMYFGPDTILLNMEVEFADHLSADGIEAAIDRLESKIQGRFPRIQRIFIESDSILRRKPKPA